MSQIKASQATPLSLIDSIVADIIQRLKRGEFPQGARLPSVRVLSKERGVSVETALRAYDKLVAQGYLEARRGAGFFVKMRSSGASMPVLWNKAKMPMDDWLRVLQPHQPFTHHLGSGVLPETWMNKTELTAAVRSLSQGSLSGLAQYQDPLGYYPLRQQLSLKLGEQGINATSEQIMLTAGAADALHLVIWSHFYPGDYMAVEEPCSFLHVQRMLASGLEIVRVPRLADGPDTDALEDLCKQHKIRAFFCSSVLQNPTSTNMSPHVAHRILKLADKYDLMIVDDDTYGDLLPTTDATPISRLATLDQLQRVIHIGSFSKTIAPGLRVGFLAGGAERIERIVRLYKSLGVISNSPLNERVVYRLVSEGKYRHHCEQIRTRLEERREPLKQRLNAMGCRVKPASAGMYLWASLGDGIETARVVEELEKHNIRCAPGSLFASPDQREATTHMRFNIAASADSPALDILAEIISALSHGVH